LNIYFSNFKIKLIDRLKILIKIKIKIINWKWIIIIANIKTKNQWMLKNLNIFSKILGLN